MTMTRFWAVAFLMLTGLSGSVSAQIITTIAGNGIPGHSGDGGPATAAEICLGLLAFDAVGNLYFGGDTTYRVRVINTSGIISTFAGTGVAGETGNGGNATAAQIGQTEGVLADAAGNIYIGEAF